MAKALRLTADQKKCIRTLPNPVAFLGKKKGGPKGGGPYVLFGRPDEAKKCAQEQIHTVLTTVLTPEQRKKWEELVGDPFLGEFHREPLWFPLPGPPERPPGPHDRRRHGSDPGPGGPGLRPGPGGRGGP